MCQVEQEEPDLPHAEEAEPRVAGPRHPDLSHPDPGRRSQTDPGVVHPDRGLYSEAEAHEGDHPREDPVGPLEWHG